MDEQETEQFIKDISDLFFPPSHETFFDRVSRVDNINKKYYHDKFTIDQVINIARQL